MTEKYYKWTAPGGQAPLAPDYRYPLPVKNADGSWTPGAWTEPVEGELEMCANGYHVCRPTDLVNWINAELYECEIDGDQAACNDPKESKLCVRRIRLTRRVESWNERTARLFAVWCARQALALVPDPDPRSVAAVDTAERFAYGHATAGELDAAGEAAWAAVDAAWAAVDAAWAAVDAAWVAEAAARAAWNAAGAAGAAGAADAAARAAAGAAAWATAGGEARAAGAAARAAQNAKLLEMIEEERHD